MPQSSPFKNNTQTGDQVYTQVDIDSAQKKLYSRLKQLKIAVEGIGVIERENTPPILVVSLLKSSFERYANKIPGEIQGFAVEPELTVKAVHLGSRPKLKNSK